MNRIKLYTDEHIAKSVVNGLRLRGVDVLTCQETKMLGAQDSDHLQYAADQHRVMLTQDIDFLKMHSNGFEHSGIFYARQGSKIGYIVRRIVLIVKVLTAMDMINHVEFL